MKKVPKGKHQTKGEKIKKNKSDPKQKINKIKIALLIIIAIILIVVVIKNLKNKASVETTSNQENVKIEENVQEPAENVQEKKPEKEITDWRLRLANYDNLLPEDFEVELANIDNSKDSKQFDARAIKYLRDMLNAMKKDGNTKIWCQSTYRSVKRQKELYDASVQKYLKQGKTQEEADKLTLEYINRPGGSDHNLGLAVDFNYVDNSFAKTSEYKWLLKNAENYGFILRYPEDKEDKTKIAYESWHWRYVGEENAKRMNELNMCLEEYVEYLQNGNK